MKQPGEPLIFEQTSEGRCGMDVAEPGEIPLEAELLRGDLDGFPELSEPEVVRHYLRLSKLNFAAATTLYPLGSCTMKYSPLANEAFAAMSGFAAVHPYSPDQAVQGTLRLLQELEQWLCEISGLAAVSLQPAAGAQGELTGMKIVRAWHEAHGSPRSKVLIPSSAHGTNPASAALSGYSAISIACDERGLTSARAVRELLDREVAAIMITNPNTLGLFEVEIKEIAGAVHQAGGLVYMDGANMNALLGVAKPASMGVDLLQFNLHKTFSTPHGGGGPGAGPVAVRAELEPYLPLPRLLERNGKLCWDHDRPRSIGRVRSFYGNFAVLLRAYTYLLACGGDGLSAATEAAVLAANYLRAKLSAAYHLPYDRPCMHEVVLTDRVQSSYGVKTLDIAKRLLDFGFHAPTIYFPLVVSGALMIEPTESESIESLDAFVQAMLCIAKEAREAPEIVRRAPHDAPFARFDETRAARHPVLAWKPEETRG